MVRRAPNRRKIQNKTKVAYIRFFDAHVEDMSMRAIATELGITLSMLQRYLKQRQRIFAIRNPCAGSVCTGRISKLNDIEEDLLQWFFEKREQGMGVTTQMVLLKAFELMPEFREDPSTQLAKTFVIRRLLIHNLLVHRIATHVCQRSPALARYQAIDFVASVRQVLRNNPRHPKWIMNMDQTPIWFSMTHKRTLDVQGSRSINVRNCTSSTVRSTLAPCICADGTQLMPFLIFKGKRQGRIERREFSTYPEGCFYAVQDNAWMDEIAMLSWVNNVLKPHVANAPDNIIPIILLDSYRCHTMQSVVHEIQALGVEVEHIPGGCTHLCQPVDVGYNKPFKAHIMRLWQDWMVEEGLESQKPPSREKMAEWCLLTKDAISTQTIQNAWCHAEYSYFMYDGNDDYDAIPDVVNAEDEDINMDDAVEI